MKQKLSSSAIELVQIVFNLQDKSMSHNSRKKGLVILEDGSIFYGKSIGIEGTSYGEVCFNTGMTGYQEVFTDPSYFGQIMVTTNAHIGNYGVFSDDSQSNQVMISGLVCKNFSFNFSRFTNNTISLLDYLKLNDVVTIHQVDTRALVRYIRDHGAMNVAITTYPEKVQEIKKKLKSLPQMDGLELASKVSTKEPYYAGNSDATYRIAIVDLGIKQNILNRLISHDVYAKIFPYDVSFHEITSWKPDGFLFSNGPGDPAPLIQTQELARRVIESRLPCFGICLGHQVMALASGATTFKMFNGHRGINHPIMNLKSGRGEITSQNHGFAVQKDSIIENSNLSITHVHLNDETIGGLSYGTDFCFSVQYHPEAGPGPNDADYLFEQFINRIKEYKSSLN